MLTNNMLTHTQETKNTDVTKTESSNCVANLQWVMADRQLEAAVRSFSNHEKDIVHSLKAQLEYAKSEIATLTKENTRLKEENESSSLQLKRLKSYLRSILMVARV